MTNPWLLHSALGPSGLAWQLPNWAMTSGQGRDQGLTRKWWSAWPTGREKDGKESRLAKLTLTMTPFPTSQPRLDKNRNILSDNRGEATSLSLLLTNVRLIIREPDIINIYIHQRDVGICRRLSARSECRFSWLRQWERGNGSFCRSERLPTFEVSWEWQMK